MTMQALQTWYHGLFELLPSGSVQVQEKKKKTLNKWWLPDNSSITNLISQSFWVAAQQECLSSRKKKVKQMMIALQHKCYKHDIAVFSSFQSQLIYSKDDDDPSGDTDNSEGNGIGSSRMAAGWRAGMTSPRGSRCSPTMGLSILSIFLGFGGRPGSTGTQPGLDQAPALPWLVLVLALAQLVLAWTEIKNDKLLGQ